MKRKSFLRRALAVLLTFVLSAGIVLIGAPGKSYAASPYKLVSKVTSYYKDGSKWKKSRVTTYTYNKKGDPVKIYTKYVTGDKYTYADYYVYTYKSGKKTEAKHYVKYGKESKSLSDTRTYDKKGRLKKVTYPEGRTEVYYYGKNGYITKVVSENWTRSMKYKWNGKVAKAIKVNMTDYPGAVYQATYNKKGLIEKPVSRTEANGDMSFSYTFKSGRVSSISETTADGFKRYYDKHVISYTKKSIDARRYRGMINEIMVGYPVNTGTTWF